MRRILRHRPSPALVVACLALTIALGGTSYAAITLPAGSVGTKQLKKNAVISAKVKNRSLLAIDFKRGQLPRGARGATGAGGATGATGATGPAGPFPVALPAGQTLRGWYWAGATAAAGFALATSEISFLYPLAAAPTAHFINQGDPTPAGCTGDVNNPGASPGHLCVFELSGLNAAGRNVTGPTGDGSTSKWGTGIFVRSTAAGSFWTRGTWAVTGS
jgi:hypothetical protein